MENLISLTRMKFLKFIIISLLLVACNSKTEDMKPYVIEVVTLKYKSTINSVDFWKEDAKIQADYTSKQPGFISRESGYSKDSNEVLVTVKWKTETDANASMNKFMKDESVVKFVNMIEPNTMQMKRYVIE